MVIVAQLHFQWYSTYTFLNYFCNSVTGYHTKSTLWWLHFARTETLSTINKTPLIKHLRQLLQFWHWLYTIRSTCNNHFFGFSFLQN